MFGRISIGSLFVLALLAPGMCWAQAGYGYGPAYGPPGAMMPPQAGQYAPGYGGMAGPGSGHGRTIFEELPDDRGWLFEDAPLSKAMENTFRHATFRVDYLLWNLGSPGNVVLGAKLLSGDDPRDPANLPVNDRTTGAPIGQGVVPTLDNIKLDGINGARGTVGLPIGDGTFEASAFIFQTASNVLDLTDAIQPVDPDNPFSFATFVAQPIQQEGNLTNNSLVYDVSYVAALKTNVWGTEANYVFTAPNAGTGDFMTVSPLIGFRYFNYRESLAQTGVYEFTDSLGATSQVTSRIDASTNNNFYGPQIGMRAEVSLARLTIGAEPKVMLGLNSYKANLATQNILSPTEPVLNIQDKETTFGPMADLRLYSRLGLTKSFHVFASYDLLWAGFNTRPFNNIVYNTSVTTGGGDFNQRVKEVDTTLQGLSVGGEFRY